MDTIFPQQQISASHTRCSLVRYSGCHIRSPTGNSPRTTSIPLLYQDLPESILSSDTKLVAYDSLLFKVIENDNDRELLQRDLSALELCEETWQKKIIIWKAQGVPQ